MDCRAESVSLGPRVSSVWPWPLLLPLAAVRWGLLGPSWAPCLWGAAWALGGSGLAGSRALRALRALAPLRSLAGPVGPRGPLGPPPPGWPLALATPAARARAWLEALGASGAAGTAVGAGWRRTRSGRLWRARSPALGPPARERTGAPCSSPLSSLSLSRSAFGRSRERRRPRLCQGGVAWVGVNQVWPQGVRRGGRGGGGSLAHLRWASLGGACRLPHFGAASVWRCFESPRVLLAPGRPGGPLGPRHKLAAWRAGLLGANAWG